MTFSEIRHTLARAMIITRREVLDQMRDWRIIAPMMVLTLFFPLLMNFTANQAVNFVTKYGAEVIGDRLIPFLLMVVGFFPTSVSLVIALESFVGEKERHSLEPLLSSPMSDLELYIGKTLAAMVPPLLAAYLGVAVYLGGLAWSIGWYATPTLLVQILALTTVQAVVMVSAAVVISAQVTSVRASNLLSSFVVIPFAILIQGESIIMFWAQYDVLWWVLVGLVLLTVVLIRMGVRLFNREDLLGRDIDEINLKGGWAVFRTAYGGAGRGLGVGGWYRTEVWATLQRLKIPIVILTLALAMGSIIGYNYAPLYPLPLEIADVHDLAKTFGENVARYGFVSPLGAGWVLLTNLRALALATGLGAFSLGVLGVILLMLPLALVGYFAGQMTALGISPWLFYVAFILPHGIFEIPAAILTGAAILRLGASILAPPPGKTLGEGWLMALADWAKIMLAVTMPLLVAAALVEALITPRVVMAVFGG